MVGTPSNSHPAAFINVPDREVVERLVEEMRRFRPQVVLTFETGGLYGHPDHIAISRQTTEAFKLAADPAAFPHQLVGGVEPYAPSRLFYSARPKGFRMEWALKLREAGVDVPLPTPERATEGTPPEEIHLEMDVGEHLETKKACILCHWTQVAQDWPYDKVPHEVAAFVLGREYYIQAEPQLAAGEKMPADFFHGLPGD